MSASLGLFLLSQTFSFFQQQKYYIYWMGKKVQIVLTYILWLSIRGSIPKPQKDKQKGRDQAGGFTIGPNLGH
jgi:hypothetical protein